MLSPARQRYRLRNVASIMLRYALLLVLGCIFVIPFVWMVSTAFKEPGQAFQFPPEWIPRPIIFDSFRAIWNGPIPFGRFYWNTIIVVVMVEIGTVLSCTLVAYGFARLHWWGRDFWFIVLLGTIMLPYHVTMIPVYVIFRNLGWVDTLKPLIVPAFFGNAFYIFLLRQFFLGIPQDLEDAARVDGAGSLRILWQLLLPLSMPILVTVVIFTFVGTWNDFTGPLIYLESIDKMTVSVGLAMYQGTYSTNWPQLTAAATLAMLPVLLVFLAGQRYFVQGIAVTGMK